VHTELGRSQVEVQQCALSSEVGKELGEEAWRRVGKAELEVEVDALEAKQAEEAEEDEEEKEKGEEEEEEEEKEEEEKS